MTASYAFDGLDRRKSKTVNGTTTVFVTDADNREVLEYDSSTGAIQRWYAYGLGPNDVLGQMNVTSGARSTPVPDVLGSIIGKMDASSGELTSFAYRPYGAATSMPAPFGYTGQRVDAESGLSYYRARNYSPQWGRFLQTDPAGYAAGLLLYAYVLNDPLNRVDPSGLAPDPAMQQWRDPQGYDRGAHYYNFSMPLCSCSPREAFEAIRNYSAPGAGYAKEGTHQVSLSGFNPILQTVDVNAMTITNVTQPGHSFHEGIVQLTVVTSPMGQVSVNILGAGIGTNSTMNQYLGPALFFGLASAARRDLVPFAPASH
jgi:RHS repeat-associated protein